MKLILSHFFSICLTICFFAISDANAQVRIMPLGNSLTQGDYPNGQHSYRGHLRKRLLDNGYTNIDFVGSQSGQCGHGDISPCDGDHSGYGGYTIGPDTNKFCSTCPTTGIYEHVINWLNVANPDIILLEIGVNDFFNSGSHPAEYAASADDRYASLVSRITSTKPNAKLFIATLNPVKWDRTWTNTGERKDLNLRIEALANASSTDNIFFVDMYDLMNASWSTADYWDDVHFAEQGAKKMAGIWYDAITPHLSKTVPTTEIKGTYEIKAKHSGKALDLKASGTSNGTIVQQWTDNNSNAQRWIVEPLGDGSYKIRSKVTGKALDVKGASQTNGAIIHQWDYVGGENQKWKIESVGSGYYKITAKHSGKALDVNSFSSADGATVQQWDYNGGDNQKWQLTQTSTSTNLRLEDFEVEENKSAQFYVYPSPADDNLNMFYHSNSDKMIKLQLKDLSDKKIGEFNKRVRLGENVISISVSAIKDGLYIIQVPGEQDRTQKVLIKH